MTPRPCGLMPRKTNDDPHEVSERAREARSDLRLDVGAGNGNRTRTISLGICAVRACHMADLRRGVSASDRERPLVTGLNANGPTRVVARGRQRCWFPRAAAGW